MDSRLVSQGFITGGSSRASTDSDSIHSITTIPRLVVSSPLLLELLHVVYHALERGVSGAAHALHELMQRAVYESYAGTVHCTVPNYIYYKLSYYLDVLLVAHAIKNLLHRSPPVSLAAQQPHVVSKSMITNASFRTKKLPGILYSYNTDSYLFVHNLSFLPLSNRKWLKAEYICLQMIYQFKQMKMLKVA